MATQNEQKRIIKFRIPANKNNHRYSLPQANRYFSKVLPNNKLISQSFQQPHANHQTYILHSSQTRSIMRSASLSLSFSGKLSNKTDGQTLTNVISLPKIEQKSSTVFSQNTSQIIRSEIGCFNVFEILQHRENLAIKRQKKQDNQQQMNNDEELEHEKSQEGQVEQKQYDYYDALLMKKQPTLQRTRHFRLKHKAEWRLSLAI